MKDELLVEARMRTLGMLSGPTIHELRGAANVLALHLQLLSNEPTDDESIERRQRSLDAADQGRRRLFDVAETFVRLANVPETTECDFDLARVTTDAVALARPLAVQRRVDLILSAPADARRVHGRRDVVAQTLLEVLVGALRESSGGDEVVVTVDAQARDVHVDVRTAAAKAFDASFVDQATSAMQWAGGSLRVTDDGVHVEVPGVPGEPS
jgi:signal transduction histidine kinase